MLEGLEPRRMLAANLDSAGQLNVIGTSGADTANVTRVGSDFTATLNGVSKSFPAVKVRRILMDGQGGADTLKIDESVKLDATLYGGAGDDYLRGGGGASTLRGDDGNDTLDGGGGADVFYGGAGVDVADYSSRSDNLTINLGYGNTDDGGKREHDDVKEDIENVWGGSGDDRINGSNSGNTFLGNAGEDTLVGNAGNDSLLGGEGDDFLDGAEGNDTLNGGKGNDTVVGDYGNDALAGGDGNDSLETFSWLNQSWPKTWTLNITFDGVANDGILKNGNANETDNIAADIETVIGTPGADKIVARDNVARKLLGEGGNDTITAGSGNDTVEGGDGDDLLDGGDGDNLIKGGIGDDRLFAGSGADTIIGGDDAAASNALGATRDCFRKHDRGWDRNAVNGPQRSDRDTLSAGDGNDTLLGGADSDNIIAGPGDDNIDGQTGDDLLAGFEGNDAINGREGNDTVTGGDDNDTIEGGLGVDSLLGDDGNDTITDDGSADPNALPAVIRGGGGDDFLKARGLNQEIIIGDTGNDSIDGGDGPDILDGGNGDDTLFGHQGNDTIAGGYGMDDMHGNEGNDLFINDDGEADTMHGGDDFDYYQFDPSFLDEVTAVETIYDLPDLDQQTILGAAAADLLLPAKLGEGIAFQSGGGSVVLESSAPAKTSGGMAALAVVSGGRLSVGGTSGNDSISILLNGTTVTVVENGVTFNYAASSIFSISVDVGAGNDLVVLEKSGGANAVSINATLLGGSGNDTLRGGFGNDLIGGGDGNDYCIGSFGNDSLVGGNGDDNLNGGSDAVPNNDGRDTLEGDGGAADYADYSNRKVNLVLTLNNSGDDGAGEGDYIKFDVENILGGQKNDLLIGDGGANLLSGGLGQDTMKGGGGNDQIIASVTSDYGLSDSVFGNAGYDSLFIEDRIRDNFNAIVGQDFFRQEAGIDFIVADQT